MKNDQNINKSHRRKILITFLGVVTIWAIAGTAGWSGQFKSMDNHIFLPKFGLVATLTTWPAHELLLEFSGRGFGANALSEFNFFSFLLYFAWSAVLWSPILLLLIRKISRWIVFIIQAVLLLAVFGLFWLYGNG